MVAEYALSHGSRMRVRVFVDFWNFQSSLRREESGFNIDWESLGRMLAKRRPRS